MQKWLIYSFLSLFFCTGLVLTVKYLSIKKMLSEVMIFFTMLFALVIFGVRYIQIINSGEYRIEHWGLYFVLVMAGIFSFFANNFNVKAISLAPNASYASAISDMRLIPVAILSIFLFNSTLSIKGIIGIIVCLIGGYLISTQGG